MKKVGLIVDSVSGCWIAEALAEKDIDVLVVDLSGNTSALEARIHAILDKKLSKWGITESEKKVVLSRIRFDANINQMAHTDLVIESVAENMSVKSSLISQLDSICPQEVLIASNTSAYSITELGAQALHPERIIGMHFLKQLVEVIPSAKTSERTFEAAGQLIEKIGKQGIRVQESPGFVTTRLLVPLINEAITALLEGIASADEIDLAMRSGLGFKEGPLEMADRFGLDDLLQVMTHMFRETGDVKFRPSPWLKVLVRSGHLGIKTGKGFFQYDQNGKRIASSEQGVVIS